MAVDALLRMIVHCKLLTTLSMSVHVLLVMADVNVRKQQQQQGMISMFDQMFSSVAHRLRRVHLHGGGDSDNSDGCDGIDMWQSEEQQQQRRMDFPVVGQSAHMRGRSLPRRRRTPKKRKGESPSECGVDNNQQNACDFVLETLCILPAFLGSLTSQVHSSRLANAAASRLIQEQAQKQRQQQQIYRRRYHQQQQQIQQRHRQHQQQQRQQQQKQQRQQQQQQQRMRAIQITRDQVSVVWHPGENIQARELWRKPLSNCIDVARMLLHCGIGQNAKRGGRGGGGGRLDLMIVTRLDLRQLLDLFAHWAQQLERPQQPISVVQHGGCDMGIRRRGGATLSSSSSSAATSKEVAAKSRRVIACDPVCSTDEKDGNGKGIVEDEDNDDDEQDVEWDCRHRSGNLACEVA